MDESEFSPRVRQMLDRIEDPNRRETVACSIAAHTRPDQLFEGDPAPQLSLAKLDGSGHVSLTDYVDDRPMVLVFGSYT